MNFSYDPADLATNPVDEIRFLLGDTDPENPYLQNEEIYYAYQKWFPLYQTTEYVAATLADQIAAKYASEASYSADGVSISLGPVGDQFRALAAQLRQQHKNLLVGGTPDVGGISPYGQRIPGTKNFNFGVGMDDDLEAGRQNFGDRYSGSYGHYYDGDIGDFPTEP